MESKNKKQALSQKAVVGIMNEQHIYSNAVALLKGRWMGQLAQSTLAILFSFLCIIIIISERHCCNLAFVAMIGCLVDRQLIY